MKNASLRLIANLVESDVLKDGLNITVSVGGTIITGLIVSKQEFLKAPENEGWKVILDNIQRLMPDDSDTDETPKDEGDDMGDITVLRLKNARYFQAGVSIPSEAGVCITVNIDSIDAYNFGVITKDKPNLFD